jgi:phosphatidylserine decarboxylase
VKIEDLKDNDIWQKKDILFARLKDLMKDPSVQAAFTDAVAHVQPVLPNGDRNPWTDASVDYFINYFDAWFSFLPQPASGLGKIVPFTYFYLNNRSAFNFLNNFESSHDGTYYRKEVFEWTVEFIKLRGKFMDSTGSATYIEEWVSAPATKIDQFITPEGGFTNFNQFFTRELRKDPPLPRPIFEKEDSSVLTAPADSTINYIESDLTLDTELKVKIRFINLRELLANSKYAKRFEGGTAISCVLMPGSYHRYHSPVNGTIIESDVVPGIYNGIIDGEHWFNTGNIGESDTDFSIFEDFHRSYYIYETVDFGYVAMVPVGLNTISSVNFVTLPDSGKSTHVPPGADPVSIAKGDPVGYFKYGGSLNILIFQPGVFEGVSVLMGQRIGSLNNMQPIDPGDVLRAQWTNSNLSSVEKPDRNAKYFTFHLKDPASLEIDLLSKTVDCILYLKEGQWIRGQVLLQSEDYEQNPLHARIIANDLKAGYYTIEATTRYPGQMDHFTLSLKTIA